MKTQEPTVKVKHKKNGVEREFSQTQNALMGQKNRKNFKVVGPEEADLEKVTQETEVQRLQRENEELRALYAQASKPAEPAEDTEKPKSEEQLQAEGLRVQNNDLKAGITSEASTIQQTSVSEMESEAGDDPNPELTALRLQYEQVTGKKPGRLGMDKMQDAINEANGPAQVK
jgi:hypothetical protein